MKSFLSVGLKQLSNVKVVRDYSVSNIVLQLQDVCPVPTPSAGRVASIYDEVDEFPKCFPLLAKSLIRKVVVTGLPLECFPFFKIAVK
jgi:hypothetical protein